MVHMSEDQPSSDAVLSVRAIEPSERAIVPGDRRKAVIKRLLSSVCFRLFDRGDYLLYERAPIKGEGHTLLRVERPARSRVYMPWPVKNFQLCTEEFRTQVRSEIEERGFTLLMG
jgi:hypothetical protein